MLKIYHNPRCSKSRLGIQYLEDKGVNFEVVKYLDTPFTEDELKEVLMKLNMKPLELIRKGEDLFKKEFKGKNFTDDEWVKIMIEHPKVIERPIIVAQHKAVVARPTEEIDKVL